MKKLLIGVILLVVVVVTVAVANAEGEQKLFLPMLVSSNSLIVNGHTYLQGQDYTIDTLGVVAGNEMVLDLWESPTLIYMGRGYQKVYMVTGGNVNQLVGQDLLVYHGDGEVFTYFGYKEMR